MAELCKGAILQLPGPRLHMIPALTKRVVSLLGAGQKLGSEAPYFQLLPSRYTQHSVIRLHPKVTERSEGQSDWRLSALVQSALEWRAVVLHCLLPLRL